MEGDRVKEEIVIKGTKKTLGIQIVGGTRQDGSGDFGIFVKAVIRKNPAHKDGRLKRGDQILQANDISLVGVSNEKAVEILRLCASSDEVHLVISRDQTSQRDFRRLSNSILQEPLPEILPQATSTPVTSNQMPDSLPRMDSDTSISEGEGGGRDDSKSTSSDDLTDVSKMSSHEYGLEDDDVFMRTHRVPQEGTLTLSDVRVDIPPPIPVSPPPSLDASGNSHSLQKGRMDRYRVPSEDLPFLGRLSPDGKDMTPLMQSGAIHFADTHSFMFPKSVGLGILVGGGIGREGGPHIVIEKILDGMDAAKDGSLKPGDRLITINGEDFCDISREKALTLLTDIKAKKEVDSYNVVVERVREKPGKGGHHQISPTTSLPSPLRADNAKIFNSDTLLASDVKKSSAERSPAVRVAVPLRPKKDVERQDKHHHDSMQNRLSMDPNTRCKLDKLEWALKYIGHTLTPEHQKQIRSKLNTDRQGKVIFAEFVKLAQEMFAFRLDDTRVQTKFMLALADRSETAMPPMPKKATSSEELWDPYFKESYIQAAGSQPLLPMAISSGSIKSETEMEQMRQALHHMSLQKEKDRLQIQQLQMELEKKEDLSLRLKKNLQKREAEPTNKPIEVSKEILIKTTEMTEDAYKSERDRANQLEDSIRRMTAELEVLRGHQPDLNLEETRKRLAVIDNELRKEKLVTRRYQVAIENLMKFVEDCHEALVNSPDANRIMYHPHGKGLSVQRGNAVTGNPRPPQYLSKHAKMTSTSLAKEAKDTMLSVRKMLEVETLPFGWEETYTKDGRKYYMNHETQTTSWVHPRARLTSHSRSGSRSSASTPSQQPSPAHRQSSF